MEPPEKDIFVSEDREKRVSDGWTAGAAMRKGKCCVGLPPPWKGATLETLTQSRAVFPSVLISHMLSHLPNVTASESKSA